jgi:predicted RNase H-like HicB family nuclease
MSSYDVQARRYLVLIEGGPPSNYSAWSPDLPGCAATADSIEGVEHEMRAAIAFHLEGLAAEGEPMPEPSGPGRLRRAQTCRGVTSSRASCRRMDERHDRFPVRS